MKKLKAIMIIAILACVCLTGCGSNTPTADPADDTSDAFTGKYVVDTEYVKSAMERDDVIFVDARGIGGSKTTLEGAITMTWQQISKMPDGGSDLKVGDAGYSCTLDPAELSAKLGEFGLDPNKEIILFSNGAEGWGEDGRIAWQLITAGYTNVKIIDGGISAIEEAGLPTQKGPSDPTPCEVTVKENSMDRDIDSETLNKNLDKVKVVDVRTDEEYSGDKAMYDAAKTGHIPGAVQIRFTDFYNSDNTIKSNAAIEKMLEDAGISKDDEIVTYCTGGIRSAYAQLLFEMCGYENVKNDDESFWRWAAVYDTEME